MDKQIKIKEQLIDFLIKDTKRQIHNYKIEMKKAQEEANYHKGAMESRYDTFKEEAQMLKDGFAKQYQALSDILTMLYNYKSKIYLKTDNVVSLGSVVYTDYNDESRQFYILANIQYTTVNIDNINYECINSNTPIAKLLLGKRVEEEIEFNDNIIEILRVI